MMLIYSEGQYGETHTSNTPGIKISNCSKKHFINLINDGTITKSMLLSLKGKRLGCTCYPKCCHGDVIASFVNSINENMLDI